MSIDKPTAATVVSSKPNCKNGFAEIFFKYVSDDSVAHLPILSHPSPSLATLLLIINNPSPYIINHCPT